MTVARRPPFLCSATLPSGAAPLVGNVTGVAQHDVNVWSWSFDQDVTAVGVPTGFEVRRSGVWKAPTAIHATTTRTVSLIYAGSDDADLWRLLDPNTGITVTGGTLTAPANGATT